MSTKKPTQISYAVAGLLILLLGVLALPNFLPARIVTNEPLTIRIKVTDQKTGHPVARAQVRLLSIHEDKANPSREPEAVTDGKGICEFRRGFKVTGVAGRSGPFHLSDQVLLVVTASGFKLWTNSLATVFGPSHDYFKGSNILTHTVFLETQPPSQRN